METLNFENIVKGKAVQFEGVQIVPLVKWARQTASADSRVVASWIMEPIGIQILNETEPYALDLDGRRSEELAKL